MKKLLLLAAVAVFGFTNVNAQDEEKTFGFSEGDIILEGNIGLNSENDKNTETKTNFFTLSPKVGYFIQDDLAIGVQLNIGSGKTEVSGTETGKTSNFGAGVYGRYYFLDLGQRFKTFGELGLGFNSTKNGVGTEVKTNGFGIGGTLGINYFVTENIALSFSLRNVISYNSSKVDVDGAEAETEFNLGFGDVANPFGGNASFGILFKL